MRVRDTIICFVCVALAVALLIAASARLDSIHSSRQEMQLISNEPLENAPPSLAFATVAMGAFRGLVVDILWMRADKLKEQGQFFDAKQLAEWITTLQPRFVNVWDFHAWNMAYNISVAMPASQWQERWRWVRNGYELLRDRAIPKNPRSIILYRALAWIFQHKIAGVNDDCHKHYKRELALAMRGFLGPHTREYYQALAATPKKLSEILEDPGVAEFVAALKAADPVFKDDGKFVGNYVALRQQPKKFSDEVFDVIDRFRASESLIKFDTFARAYVLRNTWKLEPAFMEELNAKYGPVSLNDPNNRLPLDWEHANSNAIYWAEMGLKMAGKEGIYRVDEKNTDRIVFHALQDLYRRGKMIIYPIPGEMPSVFIRPDLRMFDSCSQAWLDRIDKYVAIEKSNPRPLRTGHRNFLVNAAALFYQAGHIKQAGQIYTQLRRLYPRKDYNVPLVKFVRNRLAEEIENLDIKDAAEMLLMSLREAYFRYAVHDDDEAFGREKWAKEVYDIYQEKFGDEGVRRVDLPDFSMLRYLAFVGFLNDNYYPEYLRRSLLGRISVERPDLLEKLEKQEGILMKKSGKAQKAPAAN